MKDPPLSMAASTDITTPVTTTEEKYPPLPVDITTPVTTTEEDAATEQVTTKVTTEQSTEQSTKQSTEQVTTEQSTEQTTEQSTELVTTTAADLGQTTTTNSGKGPLICNTLLLLIMLGPAASGIAP